MKSIKTLALAAFAAGAIALSAPAFAQDEASASNEDAMMAEMMAMFAAEPLTEEQLARLPLASEVVMKMMPPGSLGEVMGSMFDGFLGPIMSKAQEPRTGDFAKQLGLETWELEMSEDAVAEAALIIDPLREERAGKMAEVMPRVMGTMMDAMEPTMREAMGEAFAVYFSDQELTDIDAFFATESGAAFARKSMTMSSDPRVLGATMKAMPEMMAAMENLEAQMEEAAAQLPAPRGFADLSAEEQARIAELTGFTAEELEERASAAETAEGADDGHDRSHAEAGE